MLCSVIPFKENHCFTSRLKALPKTGFISASIKELALNL